MTGNNQQQFKMGRCGRVGKVSGGDERRFRGRGVEGVKGFSGKVSPSRKYFRPPCLDTIRLCRITRQPMGQTQHSMTSGQARQPIAE